MKCQVLFSRKNNKKIYIINLLSAEFAHSMVSVYVSDWQISDY